MLLCDSDYLDPCDPHDPQDKRGWLCKSSLADDRFDCFVLLANQIRPTIAEYDLTMMLSAKFMRELYLDLRGLIAGSTPFR